MASQSSPPAQDSVDGNNKFREKFYALLNKFYKEQVGTVKKPWTGDRVAEVIRHIRSGKEAAEAGARRTSVQYYWTNKYDVTQVGSKYHLIVKKKAPEDPTIRIIPMEQYFDLLFEIHEEIGHGARDKMLHNIKKRYYIQKRAIEIFVALCPTCRVKRTSPKKATALPKQVPKDFNTRGQVDVIDLQSAPDGDFKWLLLYQDHGTKFMQLRPLQTNLPSELALELVKIFLTFGAPFVLQSNNGQEHTAKLVEEVVKIWQDCTIVQGGARHPQTQGSVECSARDVEDMLYTWMRDNRSTNWSLGCHFVQYQKNTLIHRSLGKTPYQALFGSEPTEQSSVPSSDPGSIQTEKNLESPLLINEKKVATKKLLSYCKSLKLNSGSKDKVLVSNKRMEMDPSTSKNASARGTEAPWSEGAWRDSEDEAGAGVVECDSGSGGEGEGGSVKSEPGSVKRAAGSKDTAAVSGGGGGGARQEGAGRAAPVPLRGDAGAAPRGRAAAGRRARGVGGAGRGARAGGAPLPRLRQAVRQALHAQHPHAHAHRREALRLQPLQQALHQPALPQEARVPPHRRQAPRVPHLRQALLRHAPSTGAHEAAHGREAVLVQAV